jgi:putative ABC transport system permease protein
VTKFFSTIEVDHDFLKTYRLDLVRGRDFSREISSDTKAAYILNETAVKEIGWEDPLGQPFQIEKSGLPRGTVIGIVKDFHFESLHSKIAPLALFIDPSDLYALSVRFSPNKLPDAIRFVEKTMKKFIPQAPFEFSFLDGRFDRLYEADKRTSQIFNFFSLLAIFIACLGLLGISSLAITQRTKEIGIRKVLGAPMAKIVELLSREFALLVFLANILAWPLAYLVMNRWLKNFAYRMDMGVWPFLLTGLVTVSIAIFTVSFKAVRSALANPVDALRYE